MLKLFVKDSLANYKENLNVYNNITFCLFLWCAFISSSIFTITCLVCTAFTIIFPANLPKCLYVLPVSNEYKRKYIIKCAIYKIILMNILNIVTVAIAIILSYDSFHIINLFIEILYFLVFSVSVVISPISFSSNNIKSLDMKNELIRRIYPIKSQFIIYSAFTISFFAISLIFTCWKISFACTIIHICCLTISISCVVYFISRKLNYFITASISPEVKFYISYR